jgi:hypothetical protein
VITRAVFRCSDRVAAAATDEAPDAIWSLLRKKVCLTLISRPDAIWRMKMMKEPVSL